MTHNKKRQGFTIIEVLIVLAIGGLMITMVFAAIPFINRANQNNQRKNDVAIILQSISDYRLHNTGSFITNVSDLNLSGINNLGYYKASTDIKINSSPATNPDYDTTKVYIYNYSKCSQSNDGTKVAGGSRDIVALFALDKGSGTNSGSPQCKEM
jgi:prepilin-type N-terminal cleavage/methylation domain-containing protein